MMKFQFPDENLSLQLRNSLFQIYQFDGFGYTQKGKVSKIKKQAREPPTKRRLYYM